VRVTFIGWIEFFLVIVYVIGICIYERAAFEDFDKFVILYEELPFIVEDLLRNRIGFPIGTLIADY
jgi:hypothetical protein